MSRVLAGRRTTSLGPVALALSLWLTACEATPTGSARTAQSPAPTRTPAPATGCANEPRVLAAGQLRAPGRVRADLDGSGGEDVAWLADDPRGAPGCRSFLVADVGAGLLVASVAGAEDSSGGVLDLPALREAVDVDGRPGAEILVDVAAGASTGFVAVFTVHSGELTRVTARGPGSPPRGLFLYGGSVGHIHAVDCAGEGVVIVSEASAQAVRYAVTRRFLVVRGATWEVDPGRTSRARAAPRAVFERYAEFRSSPFLGCGPSAG
jgi:hypothetical protein